MLLLLRAAEIVNRLLWRRCIVGLPSQSAIPQLANKAKQRQKQRTYRRSLFEVVYSSLLKSWKRKLFDV
jgi:hypothetical protein